jgi:hypothetical protein
MASTEDIARIYSLVAEAERIAGKVLTPAGRQVLTIPIVEYLDGSTLTANWVMVQASIGKVISELERDTELEKKYTSRSVVKSFWANFCNIPPICGPTAP